MDSQDHLSRGSETPPPCWSHKAWRCPTMLRVCRWPSASHGCCPHSALVWPSPSRPNNRWAGCSFLYWSSTSLHMRARTKEGSPDPSNLPLWQSLNVFNLNFPKIDSWRGTKSWELCSESSQKSSKLGDGTVLPEFVQNCNRPYCPHPFSLP